MNRHTSFRPSLFRYRGVQCGECGGAKRVRGCFGGGPYPCDECGEIGWVGATCSDCGEENPLNEDGVCAECLELTECVGDPLFKARRMM